jgi:hypothetical protein
MSASPPRLRGTASPSHSQEAILESKSSHDAVSALLDSLSPPTSALSPSPTSGQPMPQQTTAPKHNPSARDHQSLTIRAPGISDSSQTPARPVTLQAAPPAKRRRAPGTPHVPPPSQSTLHRPAEHPNRHESQRGTSLSKAQRIEPRPGPLNSQPRPPTLPGKPGHIRQPRRPPSRMGDPHAPPPQPPQRI